MEETKISVKMSRVNIYVEISCLIILIAYWIYLNVVYNSLPELIPIHFNSAGEVDRYGNKSNLYELPSIATILYVILTGVSLFIYFFKNSLVLSSQESENKLKNTFNTVRFLKFAIVIAFISATLFILIKI